MRYQLSLASPETHEISVTLRLDRPDPKGQRLRMPAWTPGSYMVRDFARHVVMLEARDGRGRQVPVEKTDKDTWHCAPVEGVLEVVWRVYAHDPSVRAATLDLQGGFVNGTSVFLEPVGQSSQEFLLDVEPPDRPDTSDWSLVTGLPAVASDIRGFGRYRADDFEALVDHPLLFGPIQVLEFDVGGIPHHVALNSRERVDQERFCSDLADICAQHAALFGALPVRSFHFLMHVVASGYGGLEHRNSTLLEVARESLPLPGEGERSAAYRQLLGLCSHEYFHLWHVKRIRPAAHTPLDFSREVHTELLWSFEGMTSYYDDLGLLRSGVLTVEQWLTQIGYIMTRVHRGAGRHLQSIAESSRDAWTRFYKADENAPNAIVSYYAKGALVALALDLLIRQHTQNRKSLDDVMRCLWERHGQTGIGVEEAGIDQIINEVAGTSLDDFLARCVRGTEDPDLHSLLPAFGVDVKWQPAPATPTWSPALGAVLTMEGDFPVIRQVLAGRAAQRAGLTAGDRVVAADRHHYGQGLSGLLARMPAGETVCFHVLRNGCLLDMPVQLDEPPHEQCQLAIASDTNVWRKAWIGV